MNKRALSISAIVFVLFAALLYLLPTPLAETFTQTRLDALNRSGQPVGCPPCGLGSTCKTQERVLQELMPQPEFKRITMLRIS